MILAKVEFLKDCLLINLLFESSGIWTKDNKLMGREAYISRFHEEQVDAEGS